VKDIASTIHELNPLLYIYILYLLYRVILNLIMRTHLSLFSSRAAQTVNTRASLMSGSMLELEIHKLFKIELNNGPPSSVVEI
jgi:hypothetical protein